MAKAKGGALVVPEAGVSVSSTAVTLGEAEQRLAEYLGLDIFENPNVRMNQAVLHFSVATRHLVAVGVLLLSVKHELGQEAFYALIDERDIPKQRAYELMSAAAFAARLTDAQREQVMALPKMKMLALASASPKVFEQILGDGEIDVDVTTLSTKAMRERIKSLEAALADRDVLLETAEAKAEAAIKAAAKKPPGGDMPAVIADIRMEVAALVQQTKLAVDGLESLARELVHLVGMDAVHKWVEPTACLQIAGLLALRVQVDGLVEQVIKAHGMVDIKPQPMSNLLPSEVEAIAMKWADLVSIHEHQKALREWERKQARPKGRGRPEAKPEAPKTFGGSENE